MLRRVALLHGTGGAAAGWPIAVLAQQPAGRVYRVGYLMIPSREQQLHLIKALDRRVGVGSGPVVAAPMVIRGFTNGFSVV